MSEHEEWRHQAQKVALKLFHLANKEQILLIEQGSTFVQNSESQRGFLERLDDWAAGLMVSSNFETRIALEEFREQGKVTYEQYAMNFHKWTVEAAKASPATASYACMVLAEFYHIVSEMRQLEGEERSRQDYRP